MIEYQELKKQMQSSLNRYIVKYIKSNNRKYSERTHGEVYEEITKGEHLDITQDLDHLARDSIADSLVELVENKTIKNELIAYFKVQKPFADLYKNGKEIFDKSLGENTRKQLASRLYNKLKIYLNESLYFNELIYLNESIDNFLDRRFQNGVNIINSVLEILKG